MIKTQPNEKRCQVTVESHMFKISDMCPVSGNPLSGSRITITYTPADCVLEVEDLKRFIASYKNGRGEVRSMEGMIQDITRACSEAVSTKVVVRADLVIHPNQAMRLICKHDNRN